MKILVTGGTGYIGSHTVVELIREGYDVVIVDNLSNSGKSVLDGIQKITGKEPAFEQFNLCDSNATRKFFNEYSDIGAIIHFAAFKAVEESVDNPVKYYQNNLGSLINILSEMSNNNIRNLVFSSSCTVYGQPDKLPVTELSPVQQPASPYGNTKIISEEIIRDVVKASSDIKAISLRYFNPIGAHSSALIGELPLNAPSNLIPVITQSAAGVRKEFMVFGDDYNTPDGSCIRDYIDVVDLASAHIHAIKRQLNKLQDSDYEVYNLGAGKGLSVLEIIKCFEKVNKLKLNYKIVGRRPGDIEQVYADCSLANKMLGWETKTSLEDTLRSAWNWEKYYRKLI